MWDSCFLRDFLSWRNCFLSSTLEDLALSCRVLRLASGALGLRVRDLLLDCCCGGTLLDESASDDDRLDVVVFVGVRSFGGTVVPSSRACGVFVSVGGKGLL